MVFGLNHQDGRWSINHEVHILALFDVSRGGDPSKDFTLQMTRLAHGLLDGDYSTPDPTTDDDAADPAAPRVVVRRRATLCTSDKCNEIPRLCNLVFTLIPTARLPGFVMIHHNCCFRSIRTESSR